MTIRLLYIITIFFFGSDLVGQNLSISTEQSKKLYKEKKFKEAISLLDSSITNYNGEIHDELIEARLMLAKNYMHSWQSENALKEYYSAWNESKQLDNDSLRLDVGMSLVVMLSYKNESDSLKSLIDVLLQFENLGERNYSQLYSVLAGYHEENEQLDSAIYYSTKASIIDSIRQDSARIPYTYYDLGNYHVANFDYNSGISKILFGLNYLRKGRDLYKKNTIELGLSTIYLKIGNITKAEQLAVKALESAKRYKQQANLTIAYQNLGNCASYRGQHEEALRYYEQADSVNQSKSKNLQRGVKAKISIIDQKLNLGQKIDAEDLTFISKIDKNSTSRDIQNKIDFLTLRIGNYSNKNFETEYKRLYDKSGAENNFGLRKTLLDIKKENLIKRKKYAKALIVADAIDKMKKDISLANNEYIIQDLEAKHRKKEQDIQIKYLDQENTNKELILEEQRKKIIFGSIALGLIALLSFFLFRLYHQVRSQKEVISKALKEKDLLLREIHHRVKNNLQLVSSLLTMQGRSINDESAIQAINEGKSRVRSMALIHQDLYNKENLTGIGVKTYIEKLTGELFSTYRIDNDKIILEMKVEDVELDIDTLVPLGLIINELITNSLKYAWPNNEKGKLYIELKKTNERLVLTVEDDGIGYNPTEVRDESFGSTLITALTAQLNGECTVNTDNGSKVVISIDSIDI